MANFTPALQDSINKLLLETDKLGDYTEIPAGDGFFFLIRINTAKFREIATSTHVLLFEIAGNNEFAVCTKL